MNGHVEMKLLVWGEWAVRRASAGLGYAASSLSITPGGGVPDLPRGVVESMLEMDSCVSALAKEHRAFVEQVYCHAGTPESHAAKLGVCRQTFYNRRAVIHSIIGMYLANPELRASDAKLRHKGLDGLIQK